MLLEGFGGGYMMIGIVRVIHILGNTVRSQTRIRAFHGGRGEYLSP